MYPPPRFTAPAATAWAIAGAHSFGLLLRGAEIVPSPWLADEPTGRLRGHLSAQNPATDLPEDGLPATVLFTGPHGYVSPRWYQDATSHVPTWNYVFARFEGTLHRIDREATRAVLDALCARFEPPDGYRPDQTRPGLVDGLLGAIVGLELRVTRVEARLKLSQNRDPADRDGVIAALEAATPGAGEPSLLDWMRRARASR